MAKSVQAYEVGRLDGSIGWVVAMEHLHTQKIFAFLESETNISSLVPESL